MPGRVSRRNIPGTFSDANPSDIDVAPGTPPIEREPIERERVPGEPEYEPPLETHRRTRPATSKRAVKRPARAPARSKPAPEPLRRERTRRREVIPAAKLRRA